MRDLRLTLPEEGSAAVGESTARVWVRERNWAGGTELEVALSLAFPFSGLSYLPIHFHFQH